MLENCGCTVTMQIDCTEQMRRYTSIEMAAGRSEPVVNWLRHIGKPQDDYKIRVASVDKIKRSNIYYHREDILFEYNEQDRNELYFFPFQSSNDVQISIKTIPTDAADGAM